MKKITTNSISKSSAIIAAVVLAILLFSSLNSINNSKLEIEYEVTEPMIIKSEKSSEEIPAEIPQEFIQINTVDENSFVNIRVSPSPNAEVIDIAVFGEKLEVMQQEGNWYKIKTDTGKEGYVSNEFVSKISAEQIN